MAFFIETGNGRTQQILPFLTRSVTFSLCTTSKSTRKYFSSKLLKCSVFRLDHNPAQSALSELLLPKWAMKVWMMIKSLHPSLSWSTSSWEYPAPVPCCEAGVLSGAPGYNTPERENLLDSNCLEFQNRHHIHHLLNYCLGSRNVYFSVEIRGATWQVSF